MGKDILKTIEKYTIKTKTKISDDGEKIILSIFFNPELIEFVKQSLSDDKTKTDEIFDFNPSVKYQRFKVKTAVFRQLSNRYAGIIFNCNLLEKGFVDIEINDIMMADSIQRELKNNFKEMVRFYYNLDEENIISFKVNNMDEDD